MENTLKLTLGDYIKEALEFENSIEYYKLQKECLGLEMLSLDYMMESIDILSDDIELNESLFMEGISDKIASTSKKIIEKIKNIWKKVISALKVFFQNVINVFTNKQNKEIEKLMQDNKDLASNLDKLKAVNETRDNKLYELRQELLNVIEKLNNSERARKILKDENNILRYHPINEGKDDMNSIIKKILNPDIREYEDIEENLLSVMNNLAAENIIVEAPYVLFKFHKYIDVLETILLGSDIINHFINTINSFKTEGVKKDINKINKLINDIEVDKKEIVKDKLGILYLHTVKMSIRAKSFDHLIEIKSDINDYPEIVNNQILFNEYMSSIMKLSITFQTMSAEIMSIIKIYLDDRQWAIQTYYTIYNVLNKFKKFINEE